MYLILFTGHHCIVQPSTTTPNCADISWRTELQYLQQLIRIIKHQLINAHVWMIIMMNVLLIFMVSLILSCKNIKSKTNSLSLSLSLSTLSYFLSQTSTYVEQKSSWTAFKLLNFVITLVNRSRIDHSLEK